MKKVTIDTEQVRVQKWKRDFTANVSDIYKAEFENNDSYIIIIWSAPPQMQNIFKI